MTGLLSKIKARFLEPKTYEHMTRTDYKMPGMMRDTMKNVDFKSTLAKELKHANDAYRDQLRKHTEKRTGPSQHLLGVIVGLSLGVATAFFMDPDMGRRRRNIARDKFWSLLRRSEDRLESKSRYVAGKTYGAYQEAVHSVQRGQVEEPERTERNEEFFTREPASVGRGRSENTKRSSSVQNDDNDKDRIKNINGDKEVTDLQLMAEQRSVEDEKKVPLDGQPLYRSELEDPGQIGAPEEIQDLLRGLDGEEQKKIKSQRFV